MSHRISLPALAVLLLMQQAIISSMVAQAHNIPSHGVARCGTKSLPLDRLKEIDAELKAAAAKLPPQAFATTYKVPLYWHVITNSSGDGALSDAEIASQVDVINQDFAPHFAFVLKNISRTVNDSWFNVEFDSPEEDAMAKSLHVGGRQDLNVNSCTPVDALAWVGKFPSMLDADNVYFDGVRLLYSTLPGGSSVDYNLGKTLTHELGHWLEVYHTFQFGCSPGDSVPDTPPQKEPNFGCPVGKDQDTCPGDRLLDDIHNYMDYTDDICLERFSQGQKSRMVAAWQYYRAGQ